VSTTAARKRHGFTLVELLIVTVLVAVLVSIAIPAWLHARIQGNEASAVSSLRAIHTAQASYAHLCGDGRYAVALTVLGIPPRGSSHAFLSPDLTAGDRVEKSGYVVAMVPRDVSEQLRDATARRRPPVTAPRQRRSRSARPGAARLP